MDPKPIPETRQKLAGYEFYHKVLGSPKYIVAPMVDQSELAFRKLTRRYGAQLVYTPMINAKMFADTTHKYYREQYFDIASGEEGAFSLPSPSPSPSSSSTSSSTFSGRMSDTDRPLIVQFCANSPEHLLAAAKLVEPHCDAVDINLGCPQEIARRGHYGAFLMDEWDLVFDMISNLHKHLSVPVTAKFRIFPDVERTVAYAQMLERAGAQILTCHGRTREQRGQNSGLASYAHIRAVKAAVSVPVFANGNILFSADVHRCLAQTGADAVMSAEGVLYNPALFYGLTSLSSSASASSHPSPSPSPAPEKEKVEEEILPLETTNPPLAPLALEYLSLVRAQRTRTSPSAVKGHLFKILRPALQREAYWDLRERLGRVRVVAPKHAGEGEGGERWEWVEEYVKICEEAKERLEEDARVATDGGRIGLRELVGRDEATGLDVLPHWLVQPYFRPLKTLVGKKQKKGEMEVVPESEQEKVVTAPKRPLPSGIPASGEVEVKRARLGAEVEVEGVAA